jgi:Fe-S oxidoreductase
MGYRILVNRMSPQVATEFLKDPMESVPRCTECGLCIQRCPYDLQVPEIIKGHYELYRRHLTGVDSSGPETAG